MAHGIGEGGLLTPEDVVRQQMVLFKGMAQQVFAHVVGVELELGVHAHDVADKVQIAEGDPGLQRVDGDAPVCPEHIVHINFVDAFFCLLLKFLCAGGKIRIFIAKELIGNLAG